MRHAYDKKKALVGEGYDVSGNSFDQSESSLSDAKWYSEQQELDNYGSSMSSRPTHYLFDEDTSSDSRKGFENLVRD
jgi:hypothetical protein